ncbi:PKD domain-containing protein [Aquimarina algiphila]|uniref:PKD domain-containing protein n=1 Tax=Aquimarina algiphila TaxID=2047982 RepID=UPI002490D559|nr:gliding motility-associated C-terminal domain-containing protein [Aquimarina algiphila]
MTITVPAATQDVTNATIADDNIRLCDASTTQVTLVGSTPDFTNETVLWEQIGGPAATIESPTNSTTQITGLSNPNSYQFRYTITNTVTGCTSSATARVRYNAGAISIVVNSGNDIAGTCGQTSFSVPFAITGGNRTEFSIINGPADSSITFPTTYQNAGNSPTTINVFDVSGTYRVNFRRIRTGDLQGCDEANDAINIIVSLNPSGSNAGSPQFFVCGQVNGNLAGSPIQDGELSVWSQVSGPNTATIADIYAQTTPISGMIPGTYVFRYTVSAGPDCVPPAASDTTIEVSPISNFPVNAGVDQIGICVNAPVQLAADPGTAAQTGVWTGPPGITFSDINDPNAIATGFSSASTTYTLTWTLDIVDNSGCTLAPASDTVDITTNADESPTAANAGVDQCLAGGTTNVSLSGNAPDVDEEGLWTVSPAAGVTFAPDATQFNAVATVPSDGIYIFTWTVGYTAPPTNTCPTTSDDVEVVIADTNTAVSAGPDQELCLDPVLLSFDMNADPAPAGGTGTWNLVSGGQFTVNDENSPTATFSNLLDGTYVFEWVISFEDCPVTTPADQVTIVVGIPPTIANIQGGDQVICGANNTSITADLLANPTTESGVWSVVSGPNTPTINNPGNNSISVTGLTTGSYVFNWTVTSSSPLSSMTGEPLCSDSSDSIIVDVFAPADAGADQTLCEVTSVLLEATAGTTGTWTQVATGAPASTITQSPSNNNSANASVMPGNTYTFRFTTDYPTTPTDCNNFSDVNITVSSGPSSPPTAGPDQILCNGDTTTATLAGNVPPGDPGLTPSWSLLSQPAGSLANITTPSANNSTITGLSVPGLYILQWNFAVANCTDEADIMRIEVLDAPTPIEAGPNQTNACQQDAQLNATAPTVGIGTWSFTTDPSGGVAVIDSPNNPQTTLSNIPDDVGNDGADDIYVLTWTVSNGGPFPLSPGSACDPQSDTVTLTFTGAPPTPADAGPDQDLCDDTQTFLDAVPVTSGTGTWTQTAGPAGATIAAPNNPNSLVIDLSPGTFEFTWTTTGGGCTSTDVMEVTIVSDPIVANAGPDQSLPEFSVVTLGATPAVAPAVGQWTQVSGPTTANFVDNTDPTTNVTGTAVGTYIFEWTITNGSCDPRSDRVTIQITPIIDLELNKSVLPTAAKVGETVTFTIAIENTSSTSNATGVEVVDIIPNGYTLVPGTVSNSGLYNAGNLSITWSGLNITSASTLNLTFDAVVNTTGPYNNSAQITASNEFDPDSTPNNDVPGEDDQDEATVTITPNDPPVAVNDQSLNNTLGDSVPVIILNNDSDSDGTLDPESVDLDTPVGATSIITDLDGDVIGFTVPGEGSWAYDDDTGELTFSPEPGFTGNPTDITYTVRDDSGNTSNVATVNIEYTFTPPVANDDTNLTPTPINDPTILNIINNDLLADGSTPNPSDVDVDLDLTTPGIQNTLNVPTQGDWVYNPGTGQVTFTPVGGFTNSPTPITYELTDLDNNQTDTALITIVYQQPPVANDDQSLANAVGTTVNLPITTNDNDPDGLIDPATVNLIPPGGATGIVTDLNGNVIEFIVPGEGTWSYNGITGLLSFSPQTGYTGNPTDITYTVRDDDGNLSNVASINIEYTPTPPIANDDTNTVATPIGNNTDVSVLDNDTLGDGSTPDVTDVSIDLDPGTPGIQTTLNVPGQGDWTYSPLTGIVTFDPIPAFTGNPTPITYELTDLDNNQTDTALITVIYQQPPVADNDDSLANTVGTTVTVPILNGDTDPDGTIDPTSVNLTTPGGATNVITSLDGDVIGFTVPGEGVWLYNETTGGLSFDPVIGFTGNPTDVTYTVDDNDGNTSNLATVNIEYTPTPPIANDDTNTVATVIGNNTDVSILDNDTLADGTTPDVTDVSIDLDPGTPGIQTTLNVPGQGDWTYSPVTGIVTFDPIPAFTGNPTPITYELTDLDNNQTDTALITVIYQIPPVADDDDSLANTVGDTVNVPILTGDTDADGTIDPTTVDLTTPGGATNVITSLDGDVIGFTVPGEGVWSYDETTGQLSFDPQDGFTGDPTPVTYTVDDNDGNTSNLATVNIEYTPTPPVANDDTNAVATVIGNNTDVSILDNDTLADGTTPDVTDVSIDLDPGTPGIQTTLNVPGQGDWTYSPVTGIVTFDPIPAFTGNPTPITYELTDLDNNQTDTALITVIYQQPPVADNDDSLANTVGTTVTVPILNGDTDPDGTIDPTSVNLTTPGGATNVITSLDGDVIGFTVPGEGVWLYNETTGGLSFDPVIGFTGNPTDVTYTVDDNDGNTSNLATVNIEYTPTPPVANDDTNAVATVIGNNTDVSILDNDTLADGTTPDVTDVSIDLDPGTPGIQTTLNVPGQGDWTYSPVTGIVTFDPIPAFTGNPTPITYELTDLDNNQTDTALITVIYQIPPVADDDDSLANTAGDTVNVPILTGDTDADGTIDPTTVDLTTPGGATNVITSLDGDVIGFTVPGEGVWSYDETTGQLSFDPQDGFTGNPTDVTYTVDDNDGNTSNLATVNIEYTPTPPVANDDTNAVATVIGNNTDVSILDNDTLADGTTPDVTDVSIDLDPGTPGIQTTLNVPGQGDWTYSPVTGIVTFDPIPAFTGNPTPITYELTDLDNNQTDTALITVIYQIPPVADDDDSLANTAGDTVNVPILTGDTDADGTIDPMSVNLTTPVGATNVITDLNGDVIGFTVPGEGIWSYNEITGELSFDPQDGFTGNPTDITYTVDDNDGNTSNLATVNIEYTPTPPVPNDDNSSNNVTNNSVTLNIINNDVLADGSTPLPTDVFVDLVIPITATSPVIGANFTTIGFTVPNEGDWLYNEATGQMTFTPEAGFTGDPTPIDYNIIDSDNLEIGVAPATITIDYAIQPPVAVDNEDLNNTPGDTVDITILTNDSDPDGTLDPNGVNLIPPAGATGIITDGDGDVTEFTVTGEGTWTYNPATQTLSFDPDPGFITDPTPIFYTVDDNDGNPSNQAEVRIDYLDVADLSLIKRVVDNDITPFTGTEITFEVRVTNDGPALATGVSVTDLLPNGYDFVLYSSTAGVYDETTGIWNIGTIPSGDTETLLIDVLVNETGNYTNVAQVTASGVLDLDSTPNNNILAEDDQDEVVVTPVLTPRIDLSVTKIADDLTPNVGGTITFTMTVTNDGPSNATNVVVTDLLASGYQYVSSTVTVGTYEPLNGSWTIGNLANSVTQTLTITANVLAMGDYTNVVEVTDATENDIDSTPANNDDTEDDQVTIEPIPISVSDLRVTKSVNNATPQVGSDIQFTILLENLGLSSDRNIVVTDLLPTGYTFVSYEATAGVYDDVSGLWTVNRTLIQGDIERLTITATVNPTGVYTNIAEITASDNLATDPNIPNNTSTIGTTPIPVADLSLTKTVNNTTPDVTDNITFTLTLTNDGPSEATGVVVTDPIPSGFNWISDTSGGDYNSGTGLWTIGNLGIGATTSIDITVSINTLGNYTNVAEVTAVNELDPDSTPNNDILAEDDQEEVQVFPRVITDISVTKAVDVMSPAVGDQITFTITITNDGPSNATGIVVEDVIASGYMFDSANPSVGIYDETIGSWDIGNLANGITETLTITVTVLPTGSYSNTAELIALDTFDPDSNPDNNVDSEDDQDTVNPMPSGLADLSIEKVVNNATPLVGDTVEFVINVTNSGDSNATGVEITDQLPIGYTFVSFVATAGLYNSTTGIWSINGTILNGTTESLIILATVNEPTNTADEYINIAEITRSDQADPDSDTTSGVDNDDFADGIPDDDESTVVVTPQFVNIGVDKIVSPVNVTIGEEVMFTITATNNSNTNVATNVQIQDVLPTGYRYVSSSASSGDYNQVSGLWIVPTVNTNETETLTITAEVLDIDDYINVASLFDLDQFDINTDNDSGEAFVVTQCLTVFNEFSPNNDGVNDTFSIDCISQYPDNRLEIYNRWGNIVFEKDGYDNSWDGTSNGRAVIYVEDKLPVGTYYYILDLGDGTKPKAGWVYLNR